MGGVMDLRMVLLAGVMSEASAREALTKGGKLLVKGTGKFLSGTGEAVKLAGSGAKYVGDKLAREDEYKDIQKYEKATKGQ